MSKMEDLDKNGELMSQLNEMGVNGYDQDSDAEGGAESSDSDVPEGMEYTDMEVDEEKDVSLKQDG